MIAWLPQYSLNTVRFTYLPHSEIMRSKLPNPAILEKKCDILLRPKTQRSLASKLLPADEWLDEESVRSPATIVDREIHDPHPQKVNLEVNTS